MKSDKKGKVPDNYSVLFHTGEEIIRLFAFIRFKGGMPDGLTPSD